MARMIPPVVDPSSPPGERRLFDRLASDPATDGWTVLHSLDLARHPRRVEGEADFVIVAPGLGMLVVEVKSHRSVRRTASGEWLLGSSSAPDRRGPFRQAAQARHSIRNFLRQQRIDLSQVPIWSAVWFTHLHAAGSLPASPEWHDWQVLDSQDLVRGAGAAAARTLRAAREHLARCAGWFDPASAQPSAAQVGAIVTALRPIFDLAINPADARNDREQQLATFLDEQFDALDQIASAPRVLFTGPAGAGKTFLAIEAARRAAATGQDVLLVCFNRLLGKFLATATSEVGERIEGRTLHSKLLKLAAAKVPEPAPPRWWSDVLPERAIDRLLDTEPQADLLIVDEAQDLVCDAYLDAMDLMVRGGLAGGRCLFFGDFERQALYGSTDGRSRLRERIPDVVPFTLTANCRNTPRIGESAAFICNLAPGFRRFRRPDDGVNPEYHWYREPREQEAILLDVLRRLETDRFELDEITILSPLRDCVSRRASRSALRKRLLEIDGTGTRGKASYGTIAAFKGLDSPAVILTDIEESWSPSLEALLYVGLTRATDRLIVIGRREAFAHRLAARRKHDAT